MGMLVGGARAGCTLIGVRLGLRLGSIEGLIVGDSVGLRETGALVLLVGAIVMTGERVGRVVGDEEGFRDGRRVMGALVGIDIENSSKPSSMGSIKLSQKSANPSSFFG